MISYFRLNDPYRLIGIFIVLVLLRLPVLLSDDMLTLPEFSAMLLGERMAEGSMLYMDVWESTAPLSAWVYMVMTYMFGRSQVAFQLVALIVVAYQSYLFNRMMISVKAYKENTYVPGLVYALLMSLFFDFYSLSPLLLSTTFLLMSLHKLFVNVELRDKKDDGMLSIGLYLGIAVLFYLPSLVYGIATLLILSIFLGASLRYYLLMVYGLLIPLLFLGCYYFYYGALGNLYSCYFLPVLTFHKDYLMELRSLALVYASPIVFLAIAILRMNQKLRLTNFQSRLVQAMLVWLFFSLVALLFVTEFSPSVTILLVPSTAFFIAHYFLLLRKLWIRELSFVTMTTLIVFVNLGTVFGFSPTKDWIDFEGLLVRESPWSAVSRDKKILVLGNSQEAYQDSQSVTPYLDWYLSSQVFTQLGYYDNLTHIYIHLMESRPELIIDESGVMPAVLHKMPQLMNRYKKNGDGITYSLTD